MKRTPIIGITGYHVRGEEGYGGSFRGVPGQGFSVVGHDYIHAVQRAGGIPLGVPVGDVSHAHEVIEAVDGLILSGGEDIDPMLYGSHPDLRCWTIVPERDRFELALIEEALRQNKPLLAVCRGMQLVNVFFGGSLYLDLSDCPGEVLAHQVPRAPRWYTAHRVNLISPVLQQLYQAEQIETNSYHHQAVKAAGGGLQVAAVAEDGIVEGLVHPDHPQLLAIQWHPEMMAVRSEAGLIPFRWLVDTIRQRNGG
ncbi:gamma-glutamyl-gamma-aminobutyrate hydrolase family protein [Effusibacillus pohliae]|uniref:gamma-glutamyl-gamma-aminobutyrate hydrolase family protein n=1 Tax=Effusibacillus pohliae TaxID=232270 RepID=UPI00036F96F8|nr:gamma-glutamyl-gamma-aminobutyrate hydrolase family protein [Effusibacillus pohliae]